MQCRIGLGLDFTASQPQVLREQGTDALDHAPSSAVRKLRLFKNIVHGSATRNDAGRKATRLRCRHRNTTYRR